jgi:hypothetical protein
MFRNERRDVGTPETIGGNAVGASARFFMLSVVTPTDARKNTASAIEVARDGISAGSLRWTAFPATRMPRSHVENGAVNGDAARAASVSAHIRDTAKKHDERLLRRSVSKGLTGRSYKRNANGAEARGAETLRNYRADVLTANDESDIIVCSTCVSAHICQCVF